MSDNQFTAKKFWKRGEPLVWASGAALAMILLMVFILVVVVMINGLGYFWPHTLYVGQLADGKRVLGQLTGEEIIPAREIDRVQFKIGNRDLYGLDFRWIDREQIEELSMPEDAIILERRENGDFYGYLESIDAPELELPATEDLWAQLKAARQAIEPDQHRLNELEGELKRLSYQIEQLRLKILELEYEGAAENAEQIEAAQAKKEDLEAEFRVLNNNAGEIRGRLNAPKAVMVDVNDRANAVALDDIMRAYRPNQMSLVNKSTFYASKVWELLTAQPREANTEGGLFPAIFGTVLMVFLMSLFCVPLGVVAAIYLREYAREGLMVRIVRIAVNNLAGVPSIVYGVFGLGFFVYGIGSFLDEILFPERLPTPTFGTGGVFWASLTLALLTVPVVIVSTEEALAAVPRGIREGSLGLGATKFQTLTKILLPMASPGIMTGLILAMARAAGEVAPLMIVGVVKLAPTLPLDANFPYLHLERKFMHLGFHIYDVGFQSPNVEAAKPMVFVTTLLLLIIVMLMSATAIYLRNAMKKKYTSGVF